MASSDLAVSPDASATVPKKSILIIGGGLSGLSLAYELSKCTQRPITVISRDNESNIASLAAAGMLAPQSERLPKGPLLDLCLQSREAYAEYTAEIESLTGLSIGYRCNGGFIAPAFSGDSVETFAPVSGSGDARWLDEVQVRELEPRLGKGVVGGWWFGGDASVDSRLLHRALDKACNLQGVERVKASVTSVNGASKTVGLEDGRCFKAEDIVIANGSWMRELLPVPVQPHKGQSFSVRAPPNFLERVLFASDTYIVPKSDGRIVIGATVEPGAYDSKVTVGGLMHCFNAACRLLPELKDMEIEETWCGLRPTTPDKAPVLGETPWPGVHVAGGYWRNGVLLAPKTAQLLASSILGTIGGADSDLLNHFKWDRFISPEGGAKIAVASRWASQMHPVYYRSEGVGVSGSVGSELGIYEGAEAAVEERKRDRELMSSDDNASMDALERAASLGKADATAFEGLEGLNDKAEALTVSQPMEPTMERQVEKPDLDLEDAYSKIMKNKSEANNDDAVQFAPSTDTRPGFDFKIWAVDESTGEEIFIPPYTSPGKILAAREPPKPSLYDANEKTYDGYVAIQEANGITREEQLEKMRESRIKNRNGGEGNSGIMGGKLDIDESKLSSLGADGDTPTPPASASPSQLNATATGRSRLTTRIRSRLVGWGMRIRKLGSVFSR